MTDWFPPFVMDDYQVEGRDFLANNGRTFTMLPVGAGKTSVVLSAARELDVMSMNVLCSGNALWAWYRQAHQWLPKEMTDRCIVMEHMNAEQRARAWNDPYWRLRIAKVGTFRVDYDRISTVPTLVVGDECQKWLRKRTSKTAEQIVEYFNATKYAALTSGTGISRGRQDFYPALQALRPKRFKSYWRFVNQYMYTVRGQFGMEILGPRNTDSFREVTADTIFRPKSPVVLPEILRDRLYVEMTDAQANMYNSLKEQMYYYLSSGELLLTQNTLSLLTRARQVLCCPKILDPGINTCGAGIEGVLDHMEEDSDRQHCVWFTPFVDAIPYMQQALHAKGYEHQVVFQHGMDMSDIGEREEIFRSNPKCVAICSTMYAQSYELETGNPAYHIGYSFNPDDNEQAEGRLRRRTTLRNAINSFYVFNVGTLDERGLDILGRKYLNTRVDVRDAHGLRDLLDTQKVTNYSH